ncbi:bifunctional homocysteine S-methyltransferase/methylenetetrahydrofolate reductase [Listeria newyorkensis]|uniref:Bifunctional homocysteine S-methyltransferase/methylenetetrahydrofolate reductase n=1 Tax=Listeria newyorkensis TaxID=1497681 RepID=A0A841Z101_9LIST|nr:bifunctional homocysteine S-methyltransferase/methylenetetrahydrofolate reductase [Listeria newyorkensis]KGL46576.1 homocysteine methyltransferase [Listeria newyorkensis]MBC1459295.1 bifunctional homocysteine S-methyltransferase/methylenetetrahydrofolate reductase [Listeria newyorkensis]PNP91081.1 bifunctional homocysteine S-methyltransferase/methylenetetrahydrofolate reductase [Listeria newyorkensis]WAO20835.1 bifunctional homocysteine S-methyltransferase/methylenetetrahydrofolate reductase
MNLRRDLSEKVLIADGAMGTLLYSYGVDRSFEELNLSHPDDIVAIHRAYIEAGADIIQTNTYSANYIKLSRYGLQDDIKKINQAAVRHAKEAARGTGVYIFGTIGGINGANDARIAAPSLEEIKRSFREQLYCLLLEGVDAILLETYYDLDELKTVLKITRETTDLPIVANVSMHEPGLLQSGQTLASALQELADLGADVVGANCRLGPYHMSKALESVPLLENAYLAAYPNASLPQMDEGKVVYQTETDYFEQYGEIFRQEGVRLIGGCCGTTPDHIRALRRGLKSIKPVTSKVVHPILELAELDAAEDAGVRLTDKVKEQYTVLVELDPPRTFDTAEFFEGAQKLDAAGVDAITISDNSLATPRISNMALAAILKQEYDIRPLIHLTTRDHNLIGMHSHIMGFHKLGIQDVLAVTGDPSKVGDFPGASSVFDLRSVELVQLIKKFNDGISYTGKSLKEKARFQVAAAFNPNVLKLDKAVRLIERKVEYGADYIITQPIYDTEKAVQLKEALVEAGITVPVFVGVMPLLSSRNAEFLHNEVPGIRLTDEVRERMREADKSGTGREEGMAIAKEILDAICEHFNGVYIITPFLRYDLSIELTKYVQSKETIAEVSSQN